MEREEFEQLLNHGEGPSLDWKRDFPPELLKGKQGGEWDKGRAKLLRPLVSIANSDEGGSGFLIYGVDDLGHQREVAGITGSWDDAIFQTWAENSFDPPPIFSYSELAWTEEKTVGIFKIERSPEFPHLVSETLGDTIFEGQVWFRRGSKNTVALHGELRRMFSKLEPLKIRTLRDPLLEEIRAHFSTQGLTVVLPLMGDKDSQIARGYKLAFYPPNTRTEVWVGEHQGRYEHILMIEPPGGKPKTKR